MKWKYPLIYLLCSFTAVGAFGLWFDCTPIPFRIEVTKTVTPTDLSKLPVMPKRIPDADGRRTVQFFSYADGDLGPEGDLILLHTIQKQMVSKWKDFNKYTDFQKFMLHAIPVPGLVSS